MTSIEENLATLAHLVLVQESALQRHTAELATLESELAVEESLLLAQVARTTGTKSRVSLFQHAIAHDKHRSVAAMSDCADQRSG
jgi:hypothetical protein